MMRAFLCAVLLISSVTGCTINLDSIGDAPLYLTRRGGTVIDLARQSASSIITVSTGDEIVFVCAGTTFTASGLTSEDAVAGTCTSGGSFTVNGNDYTAAQLSCADGVDARVRIESTSCAGGKGQIVNIGFNYNLEGSSEVLDLIDVCFNIDASVTYYAQHVVLGEGLEGSENDGSRPSFKNGDSSLYPSFSPNDAYTQAEQEVSLSNILGSSAANEILDTTFFARGHLAPDADFLLTPLQDATYYYINAAPQWQNFNGGSWLTLENSVRDLAKASLRDYEVTTGTHGVLTLPDNSGTQQEIYLSGHGSESGPELLPAPAFYWKIIENAGNGIAIVGVNTWTSITGVNWPCSDINCSSYEWGSPSWDGSIICCRVEDLLQTVEGPDISVNNVLHGPN